MNMNIMIYKISLSLSLFCVFQYYVYEVYFVKPTNAIINLHGRIMHIVRTFLAHVLLFANIRNML